MNVGEKIKYIESQPLWQIAFDGCHKMYVIENTKEQRNEAREIGYDLYPASELRDLIERSCPLLFVNRWALDAQGNDGFTTHYTIGQFEWENYFGDEDEDEEEEEEDWP